jgi:hypothetical protein
MNLQPYFYTSSGYPVEVTSQLPTGDLEIALPKDTPFIWSPQHPRTQFDLLPQEIDEESFVDRKAKIVETIRNGHIWLVPESSEP